MRIYVMLMLSVIVGLCSIWAGGAVNAQPVQAAPGVPFALEVGQTAELGDGLMVTFDKLLADSRCPATAECITAGSVRVQVSVGGQAYTLTLGDMAAGDTASAQLANGITLELLDVTPYPASQQDTPDAVTAVQLVVAD